MLLGCSGPFVAGSGSGSGSGWKIVIVIVIVSTCRRRGVHVCWIVLIHVAVVWVQLVEMHLIVGGKAKALL